MATPCFFVASYQPYSNRIVGGVADRFAMMYPTTSFHFPPGASGYFPTTPRYGNKLFQF